MTVGHPIDRAGQILAAAERRYAAAAPCRQDRELAAELALEARPAVESLCMAVVADASERESVLNHHEGLALVSLLGRRAGTLGATPTALMAFMGAVMEAFAEQGEPLPEDLRLHLGTLAVEGFVAGREESILDAEALRSADAQVIVHVAEHCLVLFLAGDLPPESLEGAVERLGREMLRTDARAVVVDCSRMDNPTPERAAEVFGAHATARMLGADCVFVGVSDGWRAAAEEARVDLEIVQCEASFEGGLRHALRIAGWELRRLSWIPGPLRTLLRNR